jgi:CxxC motif-containing protein
MKDVVGDILKEKLEQYYNIAKVEISKELNSKKYKNFISKTTVKIKNGEELVVKIKTKKDVNVQGQNLIQLLCKGGAIKKGDEFIPIEQNHILREYIGVS